MRKAAASLTGLVTFVSLAVACFALAWRFVGDARWRGWVAATSVRGQIRRLDRSPPNWLAAKGRSDKFCIDERRDARRRVDLRTSRGPRATRERERERERDKGAWDSSSSV
jgi:hypothetical protein